MTETMTKATHTPGPWLVGGHGVDNYLDIYVEGNGEIANVAKWNSGEPGDARENEANARLIAAAPELLEACRALCRRLEVNELVNRPGDECNHYDQPAYDKARAAIALAEGAPCPSPTAI